MDLLSIIAGIVLGAAFSPFWMVIWEKIRSAAKGEKTEPAPAEQAPAEPAVEQPAKPARKPRKPKAAE